MLILVVAVVAVLLVILICSIIFSNSASKGKKGEKQKNIEVEATVVSFEDDPSNLSVRYPMVEFYDEDIEADAQATLEAVKFNKCPRIGQRITISYTKKKVLGEYRYIAKVKQSSPPHA